jgi:hypothetical protein
VQIACHPFHTVLPYNVTCTVQITNHKFHTAILYNINTVQLTSHHFHTAVPYNLTYTVQITSHHFQNAIPYNVTCTVQITSHQFHTVIPYNVTYTVQNASHQFHSAIHYNVTFARWSLYLFYSHTTWSRVVPFCRIISYKSSLRVNSQIFKGIILYCVLQTVKNIRMAWRAAGMWKSSFNIWWHNLAETASLEDETGSEAIFVNTSITEISSFSYPSDVMAILNNTGKLMHVWLNIETRSCNKFRGGNAESITYTECGFVALVIQHAVRMRHLPSVPCPALQYFTTLSHKWHDFGNKSYWTQDVLSFPKQILCEICFIVRRTETDMIKMSCGPCWKYPIF